MPNLSMDPSLVVLNLQAKKDHPVPPSFDKPQFGPKESSFSKALDAATKSKSYEPKGSVAQSKHEAMKRSEDSAYQKKQTDGNHPSQTETKPINDGSKNQASVDDKQSGKRDNQTRVAQDQSGKDQATTPQDVVDNQADGTRGNEGDQKSQTVAVDALIMQVLANVQPIMANEGTQNTGEQATEQLTGSDSEVTPIDSTVKNVALNADQKQPVPVTEKTKSEQNNESQKLPQSVPLQVNAQVGTPIPVEANLETVQSQENLVNIQAVNLDQSQKDLALKSVAATASQAEVKFADLLNANDAKLEVSATSDPGTKTGEPEIKADGQIAIKTVEGQTETEKVDPFKPFSFKEVSPKELKNQQTEHTETLTVAQADVKDAKPVVINLPVIQTQLSVKGQMDKARVETPVVSVIQNQPTTNNTPETSVNQTTNVNKTEVFSQIIERAKIMVNNGNSEMEVSLKPEHLGKLQLKVSVENQIVTAKFVAESQQVKEIIETNLSQLRQNLHDTGIQVDQLMVSVGQQGGGNFQDTANFQNGFAQNNGSTSFSSQNNRETEINESIPNARQPETLIDLIA